MCRELQGFNPTLGYQIRNSDANIKVFLKIYDKDDYSPFYELPFIVLNPLLECPKWTLLNKKDEDSQKNVVIPQEQ